MTKWTRMNGLILALNRRVLSQRMQGSKNLQGLTVICFFYLLFIFQSCHDCRDEYERAFSNSKFKGVIKDAYFDSKNRGAPIIELMDSKKICIASNYLICYADPGDSIVKNSNSLKYTLYKQRDSMFFYPECEDGLIDIDTSFSYETMFYSKGNKEIECQFSKRK